MPVLTRIRRTVGRLRSMPSRSPQQLGEVAVVGPRIAVAGQLHHGSDGRLRDDVVRSSAPVPMGQCGGTVPAVSREETLGVAFAHSHDLGGLRDGKLVFQNTAEYLNPCLFLLIQRYIPHGDDCDDVSGPSRLGSDPRDDRPKCLQNDLSARSRDGPSGVNGFGEQCPDRSVAASPIAVLTAHLAGAPSSRHPSGGGHDSNRRSGRQPRCSGDYRS